jgi:hypothetical protein
MNSEVKEFIKYPHKLGWFLGFDKLTNIHSTWIRNFWINQKDYVLQAHRNSYKTTSVIITGYIWYSLLYPDNPVLLIREEATNAQNTLRTISRLLQSDEMRYVYKDVYNIDNFALVKDNADSIILPTKTKTTIEGSLDCIGAGGSLTGRHYPKIVVDDLMTINDRVSKANRDKKKLLIQELENIKTAEGIMSVSGTPWHKEDGFSILPEPDAYPLGSILIKELTEDKLNRIRSKMSQSLFAANYDLKHIADKDKLFANAQFIEWPIGYIVKGHIDPAYWGIDTTALTLIIRKDSKIIVKGWVFNESIIDNIERITKLLKAYNCSSVIVENNKDEGYTQRELEKHVQGVSGYRETQNKHYKIQQYLKASWDSIYFSEDCQAEYLNQILDYQEGESPDDAPDSLASLLRAQGIGDVFDFKAGVIRHENDY